MQGQKVHAGMGRAESHGVCVRGGGRAGRRACIRLDVHCAVRPAWGVGGREEDMCGCACVYAAYRNARALSVPACPSRLLPRMLALALTPCTSHAVAVLCCWPTLCVRARACVGCCCHSSTRARTLDPRTLLAHPLAHLLHTACGSTSPNTSTAVTDIRIADTGSASLSRKSGSASIAHALHSSSVTSRKCWFETIG